MFRATFIFCATLAAGLGVTLVSLGAAHQGWAPPPAPAKPSPAPVHGTVYLLDAAAHRASLGTYVGLPSIVTTGQLGQVSRWEDGKGHVTMTRAAVLFVEDVKAK